MCEGKFDLISLYVDGLLDLKEEEELKKHIKECNKCEKILQDYRNIKSAMNQIGERENVDLRYAITEKIYKKKRKFSRLYAAASLIIFLFLGFIIGNISMHQNEVTKKDILNDVKNVNNNEVDSQELINENIKGRYEKVGF